MARGEIKDAAEAVLRELPSVVGAYVKEDIYGHPREIHLLVRAGPEPRALARDIRDLLEERLGVPVDQRVISIAQLAANPPRARRDDAPAADPDGTPPAPAPETPAQQAETAPPPQASAGRAAAAESDPRLEFLGVETQVRDARVRVQARLSAGGRELSGEAIELEAANGRARAGAAAALHAVSTAADVHGRFELEDACVVRALDREYVLVSAFASSPYLGRRPLTLAGAQPVEVDVESAAALAALKSVNRVLALMLRLGAQ